ncbi:hypothetical protein D3C72_1318810 [compost metagenome]
MTRAGSPGAIRSNRNTTVATMSITGTAASSRFSMSSIMAGYQNSGTCASVIRPSLAAL